MIFHCRSGQRTSAHAQALASSADCDAYLLEGGLDAWKAAGLPVVRDASRPLDTVMADLAAALDTFLQASQ